MYLNVSVEEELPPPMRLSSRMVRSKPQKCCDLLFICCPECTQNGTMVVSYMGVATPKIKFIATHVVEKDFVLLKAL